MDSKNSKVAQSNKTGRCGEPRSDMAFKRSEQMPEKKTVTCGKNTFTLAWYHDLHRKVQVSKHLGKNHSPFCLLPFQAVAVKTRFLPCQTNPFRNYNCLTKPEQHDNA